LGETDRQLGDTFVAWTRGNYKRRKQEPESNAKPKA